MQCNRSDIENKSITRTLVRYMYLHYLIFGPNLRKPPSGSPLLRQVIQVVISYCAGTVMFIVLLIIPKTLPVLSAKTLMTCMNMGINGYLFLQA